MARVSFVERLKRCGVALAWLVLFLVIGIAATLALALALSPLGGRAWWLARNGVAQAGGFAVATLVVGRRLDRHSWNALGWAEPRRLPRWFGLGLLIGTAMAAVAIAITLADGAALRLTPHLGDFLPVAGPLALGLVAAALSEELMFRGYPLRRLAEAVGPEAATLLVAFGFAVAHLANPNVTVFGTVNIALAAVWLSVAFFSAGGMALAWGLHAGWNATIGLVFDAPVSGMHFDVPGVAYELGRHWWVGGGTFGPEGGAVATLVLIAGTAALLGRRWRQPARWLSPGEVAA